MQRQHRHLWILSALTVFSLGISPVRAAEQIVLQKGDSQEVVKVKEIADLAQTGELSPSLERIAGGLAPQQRDRALAALRAKLPISPDRMADFLETDIGERVVKAIAQIAEKDGAIEYFFFKRILISAVRNADLSIVGFLEAYPQEDLVLDLDRAFNTLQIFNAPFWQTQAFLLAISPQLSPNRPDLELPFDPTQRGTEQVTSQYLRLYDAKRQRDIPLKLYLPAAASERKPLILFTHGLFSVERELTYLAEHLASHGYVVAVPEHPGSNEAHLRQVLNKPSGSLFDTDPAYLARLASLMQEGKLLSGEELLNRPRDLSFVLDELARLNQTSETLRGKLGTQNVLVVGYSLGGATALSIAGGELQLESLKQRCQSQNLPAGNLGIAAQCVVRDLPQNRYQLRDDRVKAVIALSPTTSLLFGDTGLAQIKIPTLLWAESADKTTPALSEQIIPFTHLNDPKWLVGALGGTHLSVKDPITTTDQAGQPETPYSGGEVVGFAAYDVRNYLKAIALAMVAQLTDEADNSAIFLTPEYAESVSTKRFEFRLVRELPPEVQAEIEKLGGRTNSLEEGK